MSLSKDNAIIATYPIIAAYQLARGAAPATSTFLELSQHYAANGEPGIVALLQAATSDLSNAQLGLLVVTNAGFNNRPDLAMLVADAFSTYGSDHRGQVILDFAELLLSLTSDAAYGKNAVAFTSAVASNLAYAYSASTSSVGDRPTAFGSTDVTPPAPDPATGPMALSKDNAIIAAYQLTLGAAPATSTFLELSQHC